MLTHTTYMGELKVPIGSVPFNRLVGGSYLFVDKSLLIKRIEESGSSSILITRPRRFGKTFAINMLNRFYNVKFKEEESERDSFSDLKLGRDPTYHQYASAEGPKNNYPVIVLDMSMIEFEDIDSFRPNLFAYMKKMATMEFDYLWRSDIIDREYINTIFENEKGEEYEPGLVLTNICSALTRYHGTPPIILVDEYDKPIEHAINMPNSDRFMSMYGSFLRVALKGNPYKSKVIMFGIQRVVIHGLFSALNDYDHMGVTSCGVKEYFGFTTTEVKELIELRVKNTLPEASEEYQTEVIHEKYQLAKEWYDGYSIGGEEIFNPWSIALFLKNNVPYDTKPKCYWNDTAESSVITYTFSEAGIDTIDEIRKMYISGEPINIPSMMKNTPLWKPGNHMTKTEMLSLLVFAGYLTTREKDDCIELSIPNREVRSSFDELMERVYCISIPSVIRLMDHIVRKDASAVKEDLEHLMESGSYLDGWHEQRYKQWFSQLLAINGYITVTEREVGIGRSDIIVERYKNKPPLLIELKVLDAEDDPTRITDEVEEGTRQIIKNGYVRNRSMSDTIAFSVAFWKKRCEVRFL